MAKGITQGYVSLGAVDDIRAIGLFSAIELIKDRQTKEPLAIWNGTVPGMFFQFITNL